LAAQVAAGVATNEIQAHFGSTEYTIGFTRLDLKNADKKVVGHIINFRDLSEIVKIRARIQQKDRLSAMGEVVAGVAHEMRNPLFGMTTVGQIFNLELSLSPEHRRLMDSFMKESHRLNNLIQDLLDGTRELNLRKKLIDIRQVAKASIQVCQNYLHEKNIHLIWNHHDSKQLLFADPEKLEQVLVNILHNAVDASDPGGEIELRLEADSESVSVCLIDSGHGIPEKILPNIFDVFFTSKKGGTGMGLYISRNIAEAHGGTLTAENIAGKGAKFTLTLPQDGEAA
jgi:signal transduction histidine kinase